MVWSGPDALSKILLTEGIHEAPVLAWAARILNGSANPNPHVLDIGANIGSFAIALSFLAKNKPIISCFEVQKPVYYQLCGNIFLNSLSNISAFNFAIGEKSQDFTVAEVDYKRCYNVGGYSIDPTALSVSRLDFPNDALRGSVNSKMLALDDFDELLPADLLKLDIECYELEALMGMQRYLERSGFPPIIFEMLPVPPHNWFAEKRQKLLSFLDATGYQKFTDDIGFNNFIVQHSRSSHSF